MLIDTHCHLHFEAFDVDRGAVIERALQSGVKRLVIVGTDPAKNEAAAALAVKHDFMFATAGLHPHDAHRVGARSPRPGDHGRSPLHDEFNAFIKKHKPVAIGEIGLDYFKSEAAADVQKKVFDEMLEIALQHKLPVIVHSRNAFKDTHALLKAKASRGLRGVMHCFSYGPEEMRQALELGFFISFACNITFKNATALLDVAKSVPLDRLVLETDSPYLAPQVHRGSRNEPAYLAHLANFLAAERNVDAGALWLATSANAERLFGI